MQAIKSHEFVDILKAPGECDLTSHVDFESLADTVTQTECITTLCVTQSAFLRNLGIEYRAEALTQNASDQQSEGIAKALARLIGASQMGELFKVMCLHHGMENAPEGFGK